MELDQNKIMNEYVSKQNECIRDLVNKNLMLDSKLTVAMNHIQAMEEQIAELKKERDDKK